VSAGTGAAFAAIPNLIVTSVSDRETGEATGVNTIMRNIGSAVGGADRRQHHRRVRPGERASSERRL
jgi:hypothetical protein